MTTKQQKIATVAAAAMADGETPLIRNAWYVAAKSSEITRQPLGRRLLGRSVVLFRNEGGDAVALQNRCCHRSFPLSEGHLDGDTIVCGYHGFRYDTGGRCTRVPSQERPPVNIGIKAYAVIEKGAFVWIWPGDPAQADPSLLPYQAWLDSPDWDRCSGYLHIEASYVHLHENLLDLSHLSFLHANTFGTPEYARAPMETTIEEPNFEVWRHVECELPAIYAKPLGWIGQKAIRSSGAQFIAPGLHVNTGIFKNLERPQQAQQPQPMVRVAQLITPESNNAIHYYYCLARNFVRNDDGISNFMQEGLTAAFKEDVYALEHIRRMQDENSDPGFFEISVGADRAGTEMRRYLKKLADAEQ